MHSTDKEISEFFNNLFMNQESLGQPFSQVIEENLDKLLIEGWDG